MWIGSDFSSVSTDASQMRSAAQRRHAQARAPGQAGGQRTAGPQLYRLTRRLSRAADVDVAAAVDAAQLGGVGGEAPHEPALALAQDLQVLPRDLRLLRGGVQPELEPADEQLVRERQLRALPFARDGGADQPHGPGGRAVDPSRNGSGRYTTRYLEQQGLAR